MLFVNKVFGFSIACQVGPRGRLVCTRHNSASMFDDPHKLASVGGFLLLAHAVSLVISYREDLKISGIEFAGVPLFVLAECLIGSLCCTWGVLGFSGEFQPIAQQPRELPPDNMEKMHDFVTFNHRGTGKTRKE